MNHFYRARILPLYTSSPLGKGKFHFHPGKLYSKGLWSKEKKKEGVQIEGSNWINLLDCRFVIGIYESFEKQTVKR